jgi:hypothetical protein
VLQDENYKSRSNVFEEEVQDLVRDKQFSAHFGRPESMLRLRDCVVPERTTSISQRKGLGYRDVEGYGRARVGVGCPTREAFRDEEAVLDEIHARLSVFWAHSADRLARED